MIAGTGSQSSLINIPQTLHIDSLDDIDILTVGGWGNILGDEGSGKYNILNRFTFVWTFFLAE